MRTRYHTVAIALHWVMALAFFSMLASGMIMTDYIDDKALQFRVYQWHKSLGVLLLLAFFAVGAAFGLAAGFTYSLKLRRQLTALKKELRARQQTQVTHDPSDSIAD